MASTRSRSISPLGASQFEKPFIFKSRRRRLKPVTTAVASADMAYTQNRYQHHRDISMSAWSGTSDASTSVHFSTAPTSAQHSPIDTKAPLSNNTEPWPVHQHHFHDHDHKREHRNQYYDNAGTTALPLIQDDFDRNGPDEWYARLDGGEDTYGDECPDRATLAAVNDIPLYSADGATITFGSLHNRKSAINQRQLIIFVRHFYCGACQAYVKAITDGISLQDYFTIPIPTSIIIIGCGSPDLIPFYKAVTGTSFPVFAEPSRQLYKKLGMVLSGNFGSKRPGYMKNTSAPAWLAGQLVTMKAGLVARRSMRKVSRMTSGFELVSADSASHRTSISSQSLQTQDDEYGRPSIDRKINQMAERAHASQQRTLALRKRDLIHGGNLFQIGGEFLFEDGEVIWCHRMRHYRDHVEIPDIRRLLELDA